MLYRVGGQSVCHDTNDGFPLHLGHSLLSQASQVTALGSNRILFHGTLHKEVFLKIVEYG